MPKFILRRVLSMILVILIVTLATLYFFRQLRILKYAG